MLSRASPLDRPGREYLGLGVHAGGGQHPAKPVPTASARAFSNLISSSPPFERGGASSLLFFLDA